MNLILLLAGATYSIQACETRVESGWLQSTYETLLYDKLMIWFVQLLHLF